MNIRRLSTKDQDFDAVLKALLAFETAQDDKIDTVVADILKDVKLRGDAAVLAYTNRFDGTNANSLVELEISKPELATALALCLMRNVKHCKLRQIVCAITMKNKSCSHGAILKKTVLCSVSR